LLATEESVQSPEESPLFESAVPRFEKRVFVGHFIMHGEFQAELLLQLLQKTKIVPIMRLQIKHSQQTEGIY